MDPTESFIRKRLEPGAGNPASPGLYCREFLAHYENFTVGSLLFPRRLRPALAAIYAFARFSDDLADEPGELPPGLAPQDEIAFRLARLDHWTQMIRELPSGADRHPMLPALVETLQRHALPLSLLLDLLSAFRQDLVSPVHESRASLLDYCSRSADPVGRLILRLFGLDDPELDRLSDRICTGLQLANFWQDLSRDLPVGRWTLPREDLLAHGLPTDLEGLRAAGNQLQPLLDSLTDWTGQLFDEGAPLLRRVPRRLSLELALFLGGGRAILEQVRWQGVDILWRRPHLSRGKKIRIGLAAAMGRGR